MKERWDILIDLIKANDCKTIVEIGIRNGITAMKILESCKITNYYGVDIDESVLPTSYIQENNPFIFFNTESSEAVKNFKDESLDLVFIDANHNYVSVMGDIKVWFPKVKKGGILCGHDYGDIAECSGVKRAVNRSFEKFNLEQDVLENGNIYIWWVKKNG